MDKVGIKTADSLRSIRDVRSIQSNPRNGVPMH
jgi:hypothetical protein